MVNKTIYRITGSDKIPNNLDINTVQSWTDDVKWPETILQYCNPKETLEKEHTNRTRNRNKLN